MWLPGWLAGAALWSVVGRVSPSQNSMAASAPGCAWCGCPLVHIAPYVLFFFFSCGKTNGLSEFKMLLRGFGPKTTLF